MSAGAIEDSDLIGKDLNRCVLCISAGGNFSRSHAITLMKDLSTPERDIIPVVAWVSAVAPLNDQ